VALTTGFRTFFDAGFAASAFAVSVASATRAASVTTDLTHQGRVVAAKGPGGENPLAAGAARVARVASGTGMAAAANPAFLAAFFAAFLAGIAAGDLKATGRDFRCAAGALLAVAFFATAFLEGVTRLAVWLLALTAFFATAFFAAAFFAVVDMTDVPPVVGCSVQREKVPLPPGIARAIA